MITAADGLALSRVQRWSSALVQHPYARTSLLRGGILNAVVAVLWLAAAVVSDGSKLWLAALLLGVVLFGLRGAANVIMLGVVAGTAEEFDNGD